MVEPVTSMETYALATEAPAAWAGIRGIISITTTAPIPGNRRDKGLAAPGFVTIASTGEGKRRAPQAHSKHASQVMRFTALSTV